MPWITDELRWWVQGSRDPESVAFDRAWGTETAAFDLGNYEPSPPRALAAVLDALPPGASDATFLDLGSGKGRAVLLASQRPRFRRAVGIEHREALHAVAQRNLEHFSAREGPECPVFLFCGDAARHPLPGGPLVVYLYNPFPAEVMSAVAARLADRDVWVAYLNAKEHDVFASGGWRSIAEGGAGPLAFRIYRPPSDGTSTG